MQHQQLLKYTTVSCPVPAKEHDWKSKEREKENSFISSSPVSSSQVYPVPNLPSYLLTRKVYLLSTLYGEIVYVSEERWPGQVAGSKAHSLDCWYQSCHHLNCRANATQTQDYQIPSAQVWSIHTQGTVPHAQLCFNWKGIAAHACSENQMLLHKTGIKSTLPRSGWDRRNHTDQMAITLLNALLEGAQLVWWWAIEEHI